MIELFKNVIIMSIIGSLLTIFFIAIKPITEKRFSAKWHYTTKKISLLFFILPIIYMANFSITILKSNLNSDVIINNETLKYESYLQDNNTDKGNINKVNVSEPIIDEDYIIPNKVTTISIDLVNQIINIWLIGMGIFLFWYIYCYLRFSIEIKKDCILLDEKSELLNLLDNYKKQINIRYQKQMIK